MVYQQYVNNNFGIRSTGWFVQYNVIMSASTYYKIMISNSLNFGGEKKKIIKTKNFYGITRFGRKVLMRKVYLTILVFKSSEKQVLYYNV